MNAPAKIGDNLPPEPFDLISESIEDLLIEANNFLDGKEIETEEQEQAVASILTRLRREANAADDQRKAERKPHADAADAVQAKWNPLLGKADLAIATAKLALRTRLLKVEAAQRAAAEAAKQEAARQAEAAALARSTARPDDLAGQTTVRELERNAADAIKEAARSDKARPQAKGGERAVGLRSRWSATVGDYKLFSRWAWINRRGEYLTFLDTLANAEARHGPRDIPGLTMHEERKAV